MQFHYHTLASPPLGLGRSVCKLAAVPIHSCLSGLLCLLLKEELPLIISSLTCSTAREASPALPVTLEDCFSLIQCKGGPEGSSSLLFPPDCLRLLLLRLWCWSTRLGWRMAPLCTAHPLHYHGRPDVSGRIQCRTAALPSHTPISLPPRHMLPQTDSWLPAALLRKNPALVSDFRSFPQTKVLCYSTNEPPLPFPLSPQLWVSVEHYGGGVLVCRLGHMTEDIFFCYNAKEAPEKDKWKTGINPSR